MLGSPTIPNRGHDMTTQTSADADLKARHRTMWAAGDYPTMVETFLTPLGPRLVEACGIGAGQRVLDVAAGTGNASLPAAATGAEVTASDLTPELLEAGRRRAEAEGLSLEWAEADAEHLPFDDASYDVVMSSIGVMFAPHHQAAADELVRVTRPGGTIGLLSWTPEGMLGALFAMMKPFAPPPPAGRPAPAAVGERGAPARPLRRPGRLSHRDPRRPGDHGVRAGAWLRRALQGVLRTHHRGPQERREGGARARVRRRPGRVLRRVGPRVARRRAVREGVPDHRRHEALRRPGLCLLGRVRTPPRGNSLDSQAPIGQR